MQILTRWRLLSSARKWVVGSLLGVMLFASLLEALGVRNWLLNVALSSVQARVARRGLSFQWQSAALTGFKTVELRGVRIGKPGSEPLLLLNRGEASVRFWPLLVGSVELAALEIDTARVTVIACDDSTRNLPDAAPAKTDTASRKEARYPDFPAAVHAPWRLIERFLPDDARIVNVQIFTRTEAQPYTDLLDSLIWQNGHLLAAARLENQRWKVSGSRTSEGFFASLVRTQGPVEAVQLPFIADRLKVGIGADSAEVLIREWDIESDEIAIAANVKATGLLFAQPRLAREPVRINQLRAELVLSAVDSKLQLDSSSRVWLNGLDLRPAFQLNLGADTTMALAFRMPETTAQQFFDALPPALFESFVGLQAKGRLGYHLNFDFTSRQPDSLKLDVAFTASPDFQVTRFGAVNLAKISGPFRLRTFHTGRVLSISDSNPDFAPLADISLYAREALLTSEDGSFMWHRGFNEEAIRKSIAENFRQGRFARGASTVSMQLVKNAYLTPEKTLGRKLEEALIVWLIENRRLVSKERMLEVYLNIIEWGPNVYGISEAARYYFGKAPSQIYVDEAIFLTMIVPRPRAFAYWFQQDGTLRPDAEGYFRLLAGLMEARRIITPEQREMTSPANVRLSGPAMEEVRRRFKDTVVDSTDRFRPVVPLDDDTEEDWDEYLGADTLSIGIPPSLRQ